MSREAGGRPIRLAPEYRHAAPVADPPATDGTQHALLTDQVHELLTSLIVERKLAPGKKVNIGDFARRLGTSRMPVVDALNRLEMEGLVERRDRVGSFVTPLSLADFKQLFEARSMIEQWAVPKIIERMTPRDAATLRDLLRQARALLVGVDDTTFDSRRMLDLDRDFHLTLLRLAGNDRILAWYRSLNIHLQIGRIYSMRALERCQSAQREHEEILDAMESGDITRARQAVSDHLSVSYKSLVALLQAHGDI